jgi:hypothetical protein
MDSKSGVPHFETYYSFFRKSSILPNICTNIPIILISVIHFSKKVSKHDDILSEYAYIAAAKKLKI